MATETTDILDLIKTIAKNSIKNDRDILEVVKTLTERHLTLEAKVQDLESQIATLMALYNHGSETLN